MLIISLAVFIILLSSLYLYYIYAPVPKEPVLTAEISSRSIIVAGVERHYLGYIPQNLPQNPALVIALHGTGMNGIKMRKWTGYEFDKMADQYDFIVIYPDGYKGNWNDCRKNSPYPASKENIDDVGFIVALINHFAVTCNANTQKVHVFGYSNGGQMAFRLGIEKPGLVKSMCVIAANLPVPETLSCSLQGITPRIMLVSGTADTINPYQGGKVSLFGLKQIGTCISAVETAKYFALANDLKGEPDIIELSAKGKGSSLSVKLQSWILSGQPIVELYTIVGGGHVIPQPGFRFSRLMGKTATNFDTPLKALDFFAINNPAKGEKPENIRNGTYC